MVTTSYSVFIYQFKELCDKEETNPWRLLLKKKNTEFPKVTVGPI